MNKSNEIALHSLLMACVAFPASYMILALLNMNNEENYDWNFIEIWNRGGTFNIVVFVLWILWWIVLIAYSTYVLKKVVQVYIKSTKKCK